MIHPGALVVVGHGNPRTGGVMILTTRTMIMARTRGASRATAVNDNCVQSLAQPDAKSTAAHWVRGTASMFSHKHFA